MILELIPYVEKEWTRFTGGLFGAGGGAVLRAKAAMMIPRVGTIKRRLANTNAFRSGDMIEIDGWVLEVHKVTRKGLNLRVLGRKQP